MSDKGKGDSKGVAVIKEKDKEICGLFAFAVTNLEISFTASYFFAPFFSGLPTIHPQAPSFTATDLFTPFSGLAFKGIADAIGARGARHSEER